MLQKREKVNDKLRFNPGEEVLPYNFPSSNCFFFFFSEIVNYDFLKKKSFSSKEAAFEKMLILIV